MVPKIHNNVYKSLVYSDIVFLHELLSIRSVFTEHMYGQNMCIQYINTTELNMHFKHNKGSDVADRD